jgi:alanine racemase
VNSGLKIDIDLARVRRNAEEIVRKVGVEVYAVIKANAYGLGAAAVAEVLADVVQGFVVFSLSEASANNLWEIAHKPILCLGPPLDLEAEDYLAQHARPAIANVADARRLRRASPVLCVDTGMQRFACPAAEVAETLAAGDCTEAFTHATRPEQVMKLIEFVGGRSRGLKLHAAGSSLLDRADCRLDAVRPGLALYRGAARVAAPLVEVHESRGPAGYTGFLSPRHGVILAGYSHGLRPGPCRVNGRRRRILEVGMQSAFIEADGADRVGDEAILLGDGLEADDIAPPWNASPQEVLVSLMRSNKIS